MLPERDIISRLDKLTSDELRELLCSVFDESGIHYEKKPFATPSMQITETNIAYYDKVETHENCTVQILTNTQTGEVSVGWWENE